ncbi:MAG: 3'-5' exonuclease [Clostridium fessum]
MQQKLFYMSRHTVCRLIDRAVAAGCSRDEDILLKEKPMWRFKDSPELGFIENELFRYRGKVYHSGSGNESGAAAEHGRESLRLIEAATPQAEISFLCGEIRRLVASEGIRYREIAVITGDLETYSREILRQFEKNQIPCFIDYKKNILSNPMVELIRAALEVLQSGFPMNRCFDS